MSWNAYVYEEEYFPARRSAGIQEALNEALRNAPWWLVSAAVHGVIAVVLAMAHFTEYRQDETAVIATDVESEDPLDETEKKREPDPFNEDKTIDTDEIFKHVPDMRDADIADHDETDDNMDFDETRGIEGMSESPFDSKSWNSVIGVGGGAGSKFGDGRGGRRNLKKGGGTPFTESAVVAAQNWLKEHQNPDGMWSCDKFMMNCKRGSCSGAGSHAEYDTGVTGLALLAFLGAGHTHKRGRYKNTVKKALKALKERQTPDGCFGPKSSDGHWIYNHAIASMAMAEAYGMSRQSPLLKVPAQKGIDFLVDCQNPYLGWRYGRQTGENDTSVTGWAVLALKSAKISELHVPRESFEGALNWLGRITDEAYHKSGYTSKGDTGARLPEVMGKFQSTEAMTAVAVISRIFIQGSPAARRPEVLGGANLLKQNPPKWDIGGGTIDMYYWYYGTLAMFQLGHGYWKVWNEAMKDALVPTQRRKGCENGSWDPVGAWGTAGGRVYSTAINCLSLEIYYRYGRILNVK